MKTRTVIQGALLALILMPVTVFGEAGEEEQTGTITITIDGLRNCDGSVRLALWASDDDFLRDMDCAFRSEMSTIEGESVRFVFADLPFGEYAVSSFHDENGDGEHNKNFFGHPTEGYSISNGVRGGISGPPDYDDACFILDTEELSLTMEMGY